MGLDFWPSVVHAGGRPSLRYFTELYESFLSTGLLGKVLGNAWKSLGTFRKVGRKVQEGLGKWGQLSLTSLNFLELVAQLS